MADRTKLNKTNKSVPEENTNGIENNGAKPLQKKQSKETKNEEVQQHDQPKDVLNTKTKKTVPPHKPKNNLVLNITTESAISGASYAESSSTSLKLLPVKKVFMSKEKRQMMELRRAKIQKSSTYSSDSSLEEGRVERSRGRCLRRKPKIEKEIFWRRYNDFLTRSLDCGESSRHSSSDSDKHKYL